MTSASAYPMTVDELTDRVREHATRIHAWPSLRQVMAEHRVGRPKATAAVDALRAAGFDPTTLATTDSHGAGTEDHDVDAASDVDPARPVLHVVFSAPADDNADDSGADLDLPDLDAAGLGAPAEDAAAVVEGGTPGETGGVQPDVPAPTVANSDHAVTAATEDVSLVIHGVDAPVDTPPAAPVVAAPVMPVRRARFGAWPLVLIALGAFVSIWGGWVGLGELTGFGPIRLLPGIADQVVINSAITLPIGVEAYAAFALRAWLAPADGVTETARRFARRSAVGALVLGAAGQIAYHLMIAAGVQHAPWPITAFVSCLPVVVLGCGAALTHLIHHTPAAGKETH